MEYEATAGTVLQNTAVSPDISKRTKNMITLMQHPVYQLKIIMLFHFPYTNQPKPLEKLK